MGDGLALICLDWQSGLNRGSPEERSTMGQRDAGPRGQALGRTYLDVSTAMPVCIS